MCKMTVRVSILVIGLAMAVGCAPSTSIISTRAVGYKEKLSSLFVISQVGRDGEISAERFEKKLVQTGQACGIRIGLTTMSRLDLNPEVHAERMKQFAPRHVLILRQAGGITGDQHWEYYDARLFEFPETPIWRADVRLHRDGALFGNPADILANDLLRQLRNDQFISPCASIVNPAKTPPRSPRSHPTP